MSGQEFITRQQVRKLYYGIQDTIRKCQVEIDKCGCFSARKRALKSLLTNYKIEKAIYQGLLSTFSEKQNEHLQTTR